MKSMGTVASVHLVAVVQDVKKFQEGRALLMAIPFQMDLNGMMNAIAVSV